MKTPSTDLFQLIQSMSKEERRYFKVTSKTFRRGTGTIYLELFEAISRQTKYDEPALKQMFADRLNDNRFSVAKNYLYHNLLKALCNFQAQNNLTEKVRQELEFVQLLYARELYAQAEKHLRKVARLLKGIDHPLLWMEWVEWKFKLHRINYYLGLSEKDFHELLGEVEAIQKKLYEYLEVFMGSARFMYQLTKDGYVRASGDFLEEAAKLLEAPIFAGSEKGYSLPAKVKYYNIWGVYNYFKGDYPTSFHYYEQLFQLVEENPLLANEQPQFYTGMLFNFGAIALQNRRFDTIQRIILALEKMKSGGGRHRSRLFYCLTVLKMRLVLDSFSLEQTGIDLEQTAAEIEQHRHGLNLLEVYSILINLTLYAFYKGDFSLALKLLGNILNDRELHTLPDIHLISRLIRLVCHIELQNYDLVETLGKNIYRSISNREQKFKLEVLIARAFRKFPNMRDPRERLPFLEELKQELEELLNDPEEGRFVQYFDFVSWIESQEKGMRMVDVIREKMEV